MAALKRGINPHAKSLGMYVCGGKGKTATRTPDELLQVAAATGLNGNLLVRCSKLSAKVYNAAVQDGFQLYLHHFIVNRSGRWAVVQQGMQPSGATARRYHWHSAAIRSFVETPHTAICGVYQGQILNMTAREAVPARQGLLQLVQALPDMVIGTFLRLVMPTHHAVGSGHVDLQKLGAMLLMAHQQQPAGFEDLLLLKGIGPRTIQSLVLVSEVIHGTPSRFHDPARFAFAHGGKDGHPFPVPLNVYDETIRALQTAVTRARIGHTDKQQALKHLSALAWQAENTFTPATGSEHLQQWVKQERADSWKCGARTASRPSLPPGGQLRLL